MGLTRGALAFLLMARQAGVDFERTLTLGRQGIWANPRVVSAAHRDAGAPIDPAEARRIFDTSGGYADEFFRTLGAGQVDALDASTWEGGSFIHDLNQPLPEELKGRFSVTLDSGSLEHVFNLPVALRSAMELVEVGGHYIGISPANNWFGHGFYQLGPELFIQALSPENGYRIRCLMVQRADRPNRWYQISPSNLIHQPVVLLGGGLPVDIYVLAQRVEERPVFASFPQQRRYSEVWQDVPPPDRVAPTLKRRIARREPLPLKTLRFILGGTFSSRRRALRPVRLRQFASFVDTV